MNSVITADIAEAHTGMDLWRMVWPCGGSMCCAIGSWGRGACPRVGSYVKRAPEPAPPGAAPRWTPFMSAML